MLDALFYIVRHGKTAGNEAGNYRGWSNEPEAQLSGEGRDGVRDSALFLVRAGLKFPMIISDDLGRAVSTREILSEILEIPVSLTDPRLRPLDVGDFTGKSKADFPLDEYLGNKSLVIPGGESVNNFNKRQAEFFDDVTEIVTKFKKPILLVGHGSTVSFLHNHFNAGAKIGYEGLVYPSGVLMFTSKGVSPLTKKKEGAPDPLAVGTPLSGFVDDKESPRPRSCWNCRWSVRDTTGLLGCTHPTVRLDPDLKDRRQTDGTVAIGDNDCCNYYSSKVTT